MKHLIEALQIFLKYGDPIRPTNCDHDELVVMIKAELVSEEDTKCLDDLGFFPDGDSGYFKSYRYGSA